MTKIPITADSVAVALGEDEVVTCDLGGEMALLHLEQGTYYGLDAVGARIWKLLAEPQGLAVVRDTLVREFDVEPASCESDLVAVVQQMTDAGLVQIR